MAKLRDFQQSTSNRIMEYYGTDGNNRRYLLADEVGLGKTIVAGEVIDRFVKREREGKRECAIYYVCGNLALIAQNETKLRDGFESFERYEDRRSSHNDMSRLVLSFIRDNYKRDFDDLIKILKGMSIWMLVKSAGNSDVYKKEMFYTKNGKVKGKKALAKMMNDKDKEQVGLIIKMFEQYSSIMNRYQYNCLQNREDIYRLLLYIYRKLYNGKKVETKTISIVDIDNNLDKYAFYAFDVEEQDKKDRQKEKELEILSTLHSLADTYDSLAGTKTISFQSLTPRTSIEKKSNGTWLERAAAGIVYYKWKKTNSTFGQLEEDMNKHIRGKKAEFEKICSVIKDGFADTESNDVRQVKFLYQNISENDVKVIMGGISQKQINSAEELLKAIMEEMSKYSLKKAKEDKSVLIVVDEFQNYSDILGTASEECGKIKTELLQNQNHYVLLLSATPFHFSNANIGKDSTYRSGLKEIDSEVDLILNYVLGKDEYDSWVLKDSECRYKVLYENGVSRTERIGQNVKNGNMTLCYEQDSGLIKEDLDTLVPTIDMATAFEKIKKVEINDVVFAYEGWLYVCQKSNNKYYLANDEIMELFENSNLDVGWEDECEEDDLETTKREQKNKEINIKFYQVKKQYSWEEELEDDDLEIEDEEIYLEEYDCSPDLKRFYLNAIREKTLPVSYVKDTPWTLSFTKGYKVPNHSLEEKYMLSADKIRNYEKIPVTHARFKKLQNIVLDPAYKYLFIPPSKPDYELWGIYQGADYSKSLVFSKNYHTPRAFSAMLSYESERRNLYDTASVKKDYENRTRYVSGEEESDKTVKIEEKCIQDEINRYRELMKGKDSPYKNTIERMKSGDEELNKDDLFCLGSMAGYFLELAEKFQWEKTGFDFHLKKLLLALYSVFTTKEAHAILCGNGKENDSYMEKIYEYNAQGNIRAVLDEYFHLILENERLTFESFQNNADKKFEDLEKKYFSIISDYNSYRFKVKVNAICGKDKSKTDIYIYTNFAQGIMGDEAKADTQKALKNKMVCFNSPFRPFVFTTTSVGAEGLDFHWYCSNIYHWTLEMNPEKFQQKEGRINRFHCHCVRRNLGRDFPEKSWNEIYDEVPKKEEDPFWPEWVYAGNGENGTYTELKRHTLYYPGSYEDEAFEDMLKNMDIYRDVVNGKYLCPMLRNCEETSAKT